MKLAYAVYHEYMVDKGISEDLFFRGRRQFLLGMLEKEIFALEFYSDELAKANMERELQFLNIKIN